VHLSSAVFNRALSLSNRMSEKRCDGVRETMNKSNALFDLAYGGSQFRRLWDRFREDHGAADPYPKDRGGGQLTTNKLIISLFTYLLPLLFPIQSHAFLPLMSYYYFQLNYFKNTSNLKSIPYHTRLHTI